MKIPVSLELRAFDSTDAVRVREWRNHYSIWRYCRQNDLISDVAQTAWYERQSKDPSIKMYGLWLKVAAGAELVGVAGLTSIDWFNRRAEFSLYLNPEKHRQGLGSSGLRMLLAHAFDNLALEQVWGETLEGNPAMAIFQAIGFKQDGTRRAFYWKDGRFWDAHLISITREEWHGHRTRAATPDHAGDAGNDAGALEAAGDPARRQGGKRGRRPRGVAALVAGADHAADAGSRPGRRDGSEAREAGQGEGA